MYAWGEREGYGEMVDEMVSNRDKDMLHVWSFEEEDSQKNEEVEVQEVAAPVIEDEEVLSP